MPDDTLILLNYRELIAKRIAERDGTPLPNGTLAHASVLIEAMFGAASKSIRILTGSLNARVYGTPEVIVCAQQFLANPIHSLEIIFEDDLDDDAIARHPLLASLGPGANAKLWKLKPAFRKKIESHFALMDDDSYRFEADKTQPSAIAAFGDKGFYNTLSTFFDALKEFGCKEIKLPTPA
jgi:hypothetical protein